MFTFGINMFIHYGTVVGSMTAIVAAVMSFATVPIAKLISGYISNNKYHVGWIKYNVEQLT